MKRRISQITALIILALALLIAPTFALTAGAADSDTWVKTDLADIKPTDVVVITMTKGSTVYALPNDKGSSSPNAVTVTVTDDELTGDVATNLQWNIVKNGDNMIIYPNGVTDKWLYCTNSNSGVRVGNDADYDEFIIESGYLKNVQRGRYVGVYTTKPDWRCYTSSSTNIGGQTLAFYVLSTSREPPRIRRNHPRNLHHSRRGERNLPRLL